ncbi:MAG: hypothetical protein Q7U45_13550, partial [Burkholderiaceae bacterium]|nr:hypothetical protein [Burkholderiaceae bacterium]
RRMTADMQTWVVVLCVLVALVYTVWVGVRNVRRVRQGGAACGDCSGSACGRGGCVRPQPIHWHPPVGRSGRPPDPS